MDYIGIEKSRVVGSNDCTCGWSKIAAAVSDTATISSLSNLQSAGGLAAYAATGRVFQLNNAIKLHADHRDQAKGLTFLDVRFD